MLLRKFNLTRCLSFATTSCHQQVLTFALSFATLLHLTAQNGIMFPVMPVHVMFRQADNIRLIIKYTTRQENIFKIVSCIICCQQNDDIFVQLGYICIIWIATNTSNIISNYTLCKNSNNGNTMNKNRNVYHTLIRTITDLFMNQDCDEFGANVNKIYHIYQIAYETYNLVLIITTINVSDIILYQINKLIDICGITWREYLCIGIGHIMSQAYVFMLPSKFNCSHDKDLLLFHLMAMKMDGFGLIVGVINSINTIIFQVDHCCVILIVIINEFSMTVMDIFKLFCMSFCNNFLIDSVENWSIFIVLNKTSIFNTILWIMITFM